MGFGAKISLDWLLIGEPGPMIRSWRERQQRERAIVEKVNRMKPEVRNGFEAMLTAVVEDGIPPHEAFKMFREVVG